MFPYLWYKRCFCNTQCMSHTYLFCVTPDGPDCAQNVTGLSGSPHAKYIWLLQVSYNNEKANSYNHNHHFHKFEIGQSIWISRNMIWGRSLKSTLSCVNIIFRCWVTPDISDLFKYRRHILPAKAHQSGILLILTTWWNNFFVCQTISVYVQILITAAPRCNHSENASQLPSKSTECQGWSMGWLQ